MQVALITGAGSGIGLATALRFLRAGDAVVGVGRRADALEALGELAGEHAKRLATLPVDITDQDAPARCVELAVSRFGALHHLVNNAGMGKPHAVHDSSDELIDQSLDLMLRAPIRLIREVLTVMPAGSSIVNISSTYGLVGGLRAGTYAAVKAGLIGLTRHVACQYGSAGIRCNAIAPGVIPTDMVAESLKLERVRRMNHHMTPAQGWGTAEDVAAAICFLCSSDARWINGQVLAVDGGWSTTKYLSESALEAQWVEIPPSFTHSGRPVES